MDAHFKVCVVGSGAAGKTCLMIRYAENYFPTDYVPTVMDNTNVSVLLENGKTVSVGCWDYAGREESSRLRPLMYPGANIILLCFDVCSQYSLDQITEEFWPELDHHIPDAVRILVGTKSDLRTDPDMVSRMNHKGLKHITQEQAEAVQRKINAVRYIETSAKTGKNVKECITEAIIAVMNNENVKAQKRKKRTVDCMLYIYINVNESYL